MKYTKRQRHSIYKKALAFYKNGNTEGYNYYLCWALAKANGSKNMANLEDYPELFAKKPRRPYQNSSVWWSTDNRKSRERVLMEAIKETAPNGKNKQK